MAGCTLFYQIRLFEDVTSASYCLWRHRHIDSPATRPIPYQSLSHNSHTEPSKQQGKKTAESTEHTTNGFKTKKKKLHLLMWNIGVISIINSEHPRTTEKYIYFIYFFRASSNARGWWIKGQGARRRGGEGLKGMGGGGGSGGLRHRNTMF